MRISETNKYFLKIVLFQMLIFTVFRMIFMLKLGSLFDAVPWKDIFLTFIYGMRQDISIIGTVVLPIYVLASVPFIGIEFNKILRNIITVILATITIFFTVLLIIDIEFFAEFNSRLNLTLTEYLGNFDKIVAMVWNEYPVFLYLLILIVVFVSLIWFFVRMNKKIKHTQVGIVSRIVTFILISGLLFLGARGRTGQGVMNWGGVFFSSHNICNQSAINPVYNLFRDYYYTQKSVKNSIADQINYFQNNDDALTFAKQKILTQTDSLISEEYPLYRFRKNEGKQPLYNVLIILLETFSAELTGCLGNEFGLSPYLDKIASEGLLFSRFYSNGQRTNMAISATMCSYPPLPGKSMLVEVDSQQHIPSIAEILKNSGYNTFFFHGADVQFDNMMGFLRSKGIDNFLSDRDFSRKEYLTKWGVSDEKLFSRTLDILDKNSDKPFFGLLLTITNHAPYVTPHEDFGKVENLGDYDNNYNTLKYTDYALGKFIEQFSQREYFKNTIFVILGDHGRVYHHDLPFDYRASHVPCVIYGPEIIPYKGVVDSTVCSQIDIAPTILDFMGVDYYHSFFGRSLMNKNRNMSEAFSLISRNNKIGIVSDSLWFTAEFGKYKSLFHINDFSGNEISNEFPELSNELEKNLIGIQQAAYYLYKEKKIAPSLMKKN
ncbi:MAG: LTA synthase family protein [Candidatus Cloacimonetes bacterium]|nr:LTA synthase family protein [Candidatus Cloacimonadota bacterium]